MSTMSTMGASRVQWVLHECNGCFTCTMGASLMVSFIYSGMEEREQRKYEREKKKEERKKESKERKKPLG